MYLINKVSTLSSRIYNYILMKSKKIDHDKTVIIRGFINIYGTHKPSIHIGKNVVINSSRRSNPSGGQARYLRYERGHN